MGAALDPRRASSYFALEERLGAGPPEQTLAQFLVAHLAGLSPLAAEELAFRATGRHRAPLARPLPWAALQRAAEELFAPLETHAWEPHLILRGGAAVDAAPYRPRQFAAADLQAVATPSEAFERLHAAPRPTLRHGVQRAPLRAALAERREQAERKLAALQRSLEAAERADALRAAGEAVLANMHTLAPGQEQLVFGGQEIALDPARSPLENAQRYFEEYTRARDAARVVPELVEQTRLELSYLDEMAEQVELADEPATLEQLRRELVAAGLLAPNRGEVKRGRPAPPRGGYRRLQLGDFEVLLGTSAAGNDRVTFDLGSADDMWLHARGVPGSHVVVRTGGRPLPPELVEQAARLAAQHSAARDDATVLVDCAPRKHVRKIRGAPPGLVTYTHEQTVRVRPSDE